MTLRLVDPAIDEPMIRPSAKVGTVARQLDEDPSQIRRMVANGDLEAHRTGKRGIRIFLDSVEAWQKANRVKANKKPGIVVPDAPKPPSRATQAAHRQAVAHLQSLGLVQVSRR
jgi:excisionase family DNA binding protein